MPNYTPVKHYDPATDAADLLSRLGFIVLFVALPLGSVLTRRTPFLTYPLAIFLILSAALLVLTRDKRNEILQPVPNALMASAAFLIVWSAISLLWTANFANAVGLMVRAVLTVGFAYLTCRVLTPQTRTANVYLPSVGLFLALLLALIMLGRKAADGTAFFDPRAGITFAVLAWPAAAALAVRRKVGWAGALSILVAMTLMLVGQTSAFVILGVSALVYSGCISSRVQIAKGLGLFFAFLIVLAPIIPIILSFFVSENADDSFSESLAAVKQIGVSDGMRLLTGRGIGSSSFSRLTETFPMTGHSLLLEIWFDLGALGALAMAALIYRAYTSAAQISSSMGPFIIAEITCVVLFSIFGQGFAQMWWLTLLSVTAIAFTSVANGQTRRHRPALSKAP